MNLKKISITGLLSLCVITSFAQKKSDIVDISWGSEIPLPKKHVRLGFVGDLEQGFVQITEKPKKEVNFARIDGRLKYEQSTIEVLPKSKYNMFESIVQVDNRAYAMISDYDKENKSEKLLVREIDIKNGGFKGSAEELLSTTGKVTGTMIATGFYSFSMTNKFKIFIPNNGNRILVYYRLKPEQKRDSKNYDKIVYTLFERDWKPVWSKEVTMPYTEADMRIIDHRLINDEVYVFSKVKSGKIDAETKKAEFDELSVMVVSEKGKVKEHPLQLEGSNLHDITLEDGDGTSTLIAGYYKPSRKASTFTGYFTAVFNPETFQLETVNSFSFKDELISAFESERTKRKLDKAIAKGKEPGIPNMEMRKLIRRPDGGWFVVGEQYYWYVVVTSNGKSTTTTYHYLFMDVIISAVGADGNEDWVVKVPKNQHYINTTFGAGISAFEHEGNLYVFHLDHIKNKNISTSASPVTYGGAMKDASLMCIKITSDGQMQRTAVFDLKETNKVIIPQTIEEMGPGVLMSAGRRNSYFGGKTNVPALIYLK